MDGAPALVAKYAQARDPERGRYRLTLTKKLCADELVGELPLALPV